MFSFKKGVHLSEQKLTKGSQIVLAPIPKELIVPLQQHIGNVCEPVVMVGDKVSVGQLLAESKKEPSSRIHSSVPGIVKEISELASPNGATIKSIVVETVTSKEKVYDKIDSPEALSGKQLLDLVKDAGIVGLGGAGFPTHMKLSPKKPIDTLIINGCECEPFLSGDYRLMLENTDDIIKGIRIELKILGIKKAVVAIESDKPLAIDSFKRILHGDPEITVLPLKTKYPQGAEKMLIFSVLGRRCKYTMLPFEVGVVVSNVSTVKAIHDAVHYGKPLIERVVTVAGDVVKPQNLLVRIGTPIKDLIDFCGAYTKDPLRIIIGGPMMGIAAYSDDVPVTKVTTGIVVQNKIDESSPMHCINCGRCVDSCPNNLLPTTIAKASSKSQWQLAELYYAMECMECGCCSFVCPSKIPLVQHIRLAKSEIAKVKK